GSCGKHEGVAVGDFTRAECRSDRLNLVSGGDDRGDGLPGDLQCGVPGRWRGGQIGGPEPMSCRGGELTGLEVLALWAGVQPGWRRAGNPCAAVGAELDSFALHHGVRAWRQQVAGIDPYEGGAWQ